MLLHLRPQGGSDVPSGVDSSEGPLGLSGRGSYRTRGGRRLGRSLPHLVNTLQEMKDSGVDLYSIWRGKNVEDWNQGYIKVNVKGNLAKPFKRAYGALKDMKKSGYLTS